jgi:hypothetical protein
MTIAINKHDPDLQRRGIEILRDCARRGATIRYRGLATALGLFDPTRSAPMSRPIATRS